MAKPGAVAAIRKAQGLEVSPFDADARTQARENAPVVIAARQLKRRRKVWAVSRQMRNLMREQESNLARGNRARARIAELEVSQTEAAAEGNTTLEDELEVKIGELVKRADEATEVAELVSYRLLALLLIPDPNDAEGEPLQGFGDAPPDEDSHAFAEPAIEFLGEHLDVEDAAALANELTGSTEPDPQTTPSSETSST